MRELTLNEMEQVGGGILTLPAGAGIISASLAESVGITSEFFDYFTQENSRYDS